ncbi:hypothetical protein HGRIS_013272 [Hohenbuehelia grisea]|uniref:Exonuclease domain-containing protein n=1 Tax=Hohenbuehelia grisea TaxID=104357 RepID=A0ABR3IV62_9AGAR
MLAKVFRPRNIALDTPLAAKPATKERSTRSGKKKRVQTQHPASKQQPRRQLYDAFLVLDVEATCQLGSSFDYPNEIIEFPVCLMRWKDTADGGQSQLEVVDEFRSFVKPSWRPTLSQFCTQLTGITQDQVDGAPNFAGVLALMHRFLVKNGLLDAETGQPLMRFCWCCDGPWDIRDFFVKQCFISQVDMPDWIRGDMLDVRLLVAHSLTTQHKPNPIPNPRSPNTFRRTLNIPGQLKALGLSPFEGTLHSGIDDTRNIARIVAELARRGIRLQPNTVIQPDRQWPWMGTQGQVLEAYA